MLYYLHQPDIGQAIGLEWVRLENVVAFELGGHCLVYHFLSILVVRSGAKLLPSLYLLLDRPLFSLLHNNTNPASFLIDFLLKIFVSEKVLYRCSASFSCIQHQFYWDSSLYFWVSEYVWRESSVMTGESSMHLLIGANWKHELVLRKGQDVQTYLNISVFKSVFSHSGLHSYRPRPCLLLITHLITTQWMWPPVSQWR